MISIIYNLTSSSFLSCFSPSLLIIPSSIIPIHPSLPTPHTTYLTRRIYSLPIRCQSKINLHTTSKGNFLLCRRSPSPRGSGGVTAPTLQLPPRCRLQLYLRYKIFQQPPSGAGAIVAICPLSTGSGETRGNIAFSLTYCLLQGSRFC